MGYDATLRYDDSMGGPTGFRCVGSTAVPGRAPVRAGRVAGERRPGAGRDAHDGVPLAWQRSAQLCLGQIPRLVKFAAEEKLEVPSAHHSPLLCRTRIRPQPHQSADHRCVIVLAGTLKSSRSALPFGKLGSMPAIVPATSVSPWTLAFVFNQFCGLKTLPPI